jgi:ABC-type multidrug transport system fused ATPase/permease subunit
MSGRTTIVITHSPKLMGTGDRVVWLEDGSVAWEGDPAIWLAETASLVG